MTGIYKITNKMNSKCYIGQSINIERRWCEHKHLHRDKTLSLKRAFRKYGLDNFDFEILELCEADKLNELEISWIAQLKPQYNRDLGGKGSSGHKVSFEAKEIIRERATQQWENLSEEDKQKRIKNNLTGPRIGHAVSEEMREKLRLANIGKTQSEETKTKRLKSMQEKKQAGWKKKGSPNAGRKKTRIFCVELNMEFDSVKIASEFLGIQKTTIYHQLKKDHDSNIGFKPKYHFTYMT